MTDWQQRQAKLIKQIHEELWIAKDRNNKSISDIDFEIAVARRLWHDYQAEYLENELEWHNDNRRLIDKLNKHLIDFKNNNK